jgi:imidazoleglycerol-phosphate dehydratase
MKRKAEIKRKTTETDIKLKLNLDGRGKSKISTGIAFFDHMLKLFAKHGLFDLDIKAKGDLEVDMHHTIEDIGICLGQAVKKALGKKKGIRRFGSSVLPMDETLSGVTIDISGRPLLVFKIRAKSKRKEIFDVGLTREFLRAFCSNAGITMHVNLPYGQDSHHINEAIFKSLSVALREAVKIEKRRKGIPSTKGRL